MKTGELGVIDVFELASVFINGVFASYRCSGLTTLSVKCVEFVEYPQSFTFVKMNVYTFLTKAVDDIFGVFFTGGMS